MSDYLLKKDFASLSTSEKKEYAGMKNSEFMNSDPREALKYFLNVFAGKTAFSSSLSYEDQVLTDMICCIDKTARIFTLDTGRQFPETYDVIDRTNTRYGIKIEVFFPDYEKVQKMVREHGINLFYESIELRHLCCNVRKVEPLKRALKGVELWISGLRRTQSSTRSSMEMLEYDSADDVLKFNPLIMWSEDQVKEYIVVNSVPYNKLQDKGYPSIGCQPCTRAVLPGEDIRAGRWWWEDPDHRECGLHVRK
ncbi:MAG: phosphoadenylyl-sulfate reductase [Bacteroidales bacterium]|jgi:phosphoadenosine phosphosulfate reductase|nr:phosphoadenylyl-sulfate reductase [Bacteroidales bacterium]